MTTSSFKKADLIKWAIVFAVTAIIMLIPVSESFTAQIRVFLAVTVFSIIIYAFELLPTLLVGLLLPFLWVVSGCATWAQALSGWNQDFLILLLTAMIFTQALERTGVLYRIGYKIIVLCGGTFKGTIWGSFIAYNVITFMTMGNGFALLGAIGLTLFKAFQLKKEDPESIVIMAAVILGGLHSVSYCYSPSQVALITGSVKSYNPEFTLTWMQLMMHNIPLLLFSILCLWSIIKWYERKHGNKHSVDGSAGREYFQSALQKMGSMKSDEKKGLTLLMLLLIGLLIAPLKGFSVALPFFIATVALYLPFINVGKNEDIVSSLSMLPTFSVVFAFFAIGTVGTAAGFAGFFVGKLVPIMQSMGAVGSIYASLLIGTLSNFVLTPMAMAVLLPGPIVSFCTELGYNYMPHIYAIYVTEHAIFHPYEWPAYMIIFAFGFSRMNDFIKLCCYKTVLYLVFICVIMVPWWLFITG